MDLIKDKAYLITGKAWVNNHAHILRSLFGDTGNRYLLHYLNSFNYAGYVNGTTRLKLTRASMDILITLTGTKYKRDYGYAVCVSSPMLFAAYLLEWLEIAKGRLAVATYSSYAAMIKKPVGPYFRQRNLTLRELEARHLQMFYSEMLRKVKPNTVIHYHAIIHSALKYAVKTDMLVQNVADKVDRPRKNSFQPVFLSAEEMQKMFETLRGTKLELPVLVAAFYGLRRGEVVGLKWDAIDFEQGTISVKRTVTSTIIDGKYQEFEQQSAKTKSSLRSLPLVDNIREKLLALKEQQKENKRICGNCYNREYDGYVFVDVMGNIFNPRNLSSNFSKLLELKGLRHIRFHDLRHSCASLLLANDVPMKQIQEWLGHSDISTTANIYSHLDYKSKLTSANVMDNVLTLPETEAVGWQT